MAKRLSKSNEVLPLEELYLYKKDAELGLKRLFANPIGVSELLLLSSTEIENLLAKRVSELELQASLALYASLEAMFQIDFHNRVEKRAKDPLSRIFRDRQKKAHSRISFDEDILKPWEQTHPETKPYLQPIRKGLQHRHWLAHGRYWLLKSTPLDFEELYSFAETLQNTLEEQSY